MRCLNIRNLGQGKPGENDKKIGVGRSSLLEARYSQIIEHILMGVLQKVRWRVGPEGRRFHYFQSLYQEYVVMSYWLLILWYLEWTTEFNFNIPA